MGAVKLRFGICIIHLSPTVQNLIIFSKPGSCADLFHTEGPVILHDPDKQILLFPVCQPLSVILILHLHFDRNGGLDKTVIKT